MKIDNQKVEDLLFDFFNDRIEVYFDKHPTVEESELFYFRDKVDAKVLNAQDCLNMAKNFLAKKFGITDENMSNDFCQRVLAKIVSDSLQKD